MVRKFVRSVYVCMICVAIWVYGLCWISGGLYGYGYVGDVDVSLCEWCVGGVFVCICVYIYEYVDIWVRGLLQVLKACG